MKQLPAPLYVTRYGKAYLGDAFRLLGCLPDRSIDLVITSPPFALQRKKEYGNRDQDEYVDSVDHDLYAQGFDLCLDGRDDAIDCFDSPAQEVGHTL